MHEEVSELAAGLAGSRSIVFGGCGFMGSHVVAYLAREGADVVAFDAAACELPGEVVGVRGDITDVEAVRSVVTGAQHIFCFAGGLGATRSLCDPLGDLKTSARAQLLLLEAVRELAPAASVVFAGSRLEYGAPEYLPVDEKHRLHPTSPYASHKALCSLYYEMYAHTHGMRTVVLRLPNPYGPHAAGDPARAGYGILNLFVDLARRGEPIRLYGDGMQLRDFVHVDDVVRAAAAASLCPDAAGRAFNIGSGTCTSLRAAADLVVELRGSGTVLTGEPWPPDAASVETGDCWLWRARSSAGAPRSRCTKVSPPCSSTEEAKAGQTRVAQSPRTKTSYLARWATSV